MNKKWIFGVFLLGLIMIFPAATAEGASPGSQNPKNACDEIIGSWLRPSDQSVVSFKSIGQGVYQANIVELGGLAAYGFSFGEATIKVTCVKPGEYEGQVKWRWTGGREEWRDDKFTVQGDRMTSGIGEFVRR